MKTIAVIPARSGSKSVKDKNIRIMNGKPMLAYSIEHAKMAKSVDRVIVSTDSEYYRDIALSYGAEAPFLRPSDISTDKSLDIEVFLHLLKWLEQNESSAAPEIFVHLRPTHPVRDFNDIDQMVDILEKNQDADSVRSLSLAKQTPYKMWIFKDGTNLVQPIAQCSIKEAYNAPRQSLPPVYMQNACIDIVRSKTIIEGSMTGKKILGYKMDYDFDIDNEDEFLRAERYLTLRDALQTGRKLKLCIDIDGVIASKTSDNNYAMATPLQRNISVINALKQQGHKVCLFTARGYHTGLDWEMITEEQMKNWNIKYDELKFGKPDADIYIDDKLFNLEELKYLI
jgi:CMP-N-acetylneuraminic acid synthetase